VVYTDAFALGVGRRVWLEIYRRRNGSEARRARDVLLDVLLSEEPKFPRTPEELRRRARSFLDDYTRLEGDEKEFLIDIGVEGWTVQQAGARRGLSPRRAKSMIARFLSPPSSALVVSNTVVGLVPPLGRRGESSAALVSAVTLGRSLIGTLLQRASVTTENRRSLCARGITARVAA
jgi:hypothetical protein